MRQLVRRGSGSVYISGLPGTGKTATVKEVMRRVRRDIAAGALPRVSYCELNGLRLQSPRHAYSHILEACPLRAAAPPPRAQLPRRRR